ncbi:MAG: cadherin domain-containing protein [Nodosilinea sp. LVE1205-7]
MGVGQSFTTSTLGRRDRLESITIQGPSSGGESRQLTLKVWKNNGDINTFAPGALVATSTNSAQLATGQAVQFQFSGEQLDPNAVYLFSMSEGAANHVRFRSAVTNAAGQRLENGRLFSSLTDQSYDVAFTLNLKEPANAGSMPTVPVSAQIGTWAGTNHTAFGGNIDYTFLDLQTNKPIDPPTVVFAPGETQKVVRIRVNPDGHTEGLEHFTLGFSSISGATTLPNAGQLRVEITDRTDAAVAAGVEAANRYVRFIAEQSALSEDAGSDPRLMVALDRPAGATPITLTLQVSGSATPGVDYTIASTSLTFQPGEIAKFIDHTLIADSIPEGLETILISLTNVSGALVADPKPYVFYLLDKDRPQLATSSGSTSSTAAAGSTVATLTANFATGRTAGSWQIVAGNVTREGQATPAFAIDNSGKVTLANPAALPANPLAVQLTVRVTDNLGAQSDNVVNLAVNGIANPVFAPYKVALVENSAIAVANLNTTVGTDSGLTPTISAGGRTRDKTLSLSGSADRNATVRIFNGSTLLGTAERQGDSWSFTTPELPDGQHTFTAQVSNAYGTTHITNAVTVNVSSILTAPAQRALLTNVDSLERISSQADLVLVEVADANGHGTNTTFTDGNTSVRDLLVADLKTGEVQLVNRGPAAALSSANVDVTLADVSNDGRYIAFSSTAATSFGQNGTAFTDTTPTSSQTDLFVYDRQTSQLRLATWSGNQTTTASRGATAVGITADSRYLIYSTDYIERIADFSAPGKMVWTLLDGSYATPTGVSKATAVRVADLNLSKLDIRLSGSSAGQPASVRLDTVTQAPGQVTFWAEGKGTSNAVRLQLTDTSNGIEVKALAARKVSLSTDVSISSGTSTGVATFSKLSTASGVGQTFTTDALTSGRRLSQITIQGPSGGAGTTQYSLKVWKNGGTFNDFAPTELVATSVNRSAIPNGQPTVFEFSGEALDPNTVYLFSFTDSSQDHVTFRASQASGLANGRVLAASASSSTDVQFTLGFSAAAAVQGSIDWNALSIAQPINTGTGSAQANLSRGGGVGQTFTTADLGNTDRLTSISIQGPSDSSTGAVYTLKVYENTGAFTSFSPGTLVATSTNTASLPNNTRSTFSFSGETLQSNKVYLFSLTDSSGNNHVGFRGSVTNAAATTLADGQLFSSLTNASTYDLAFSLNLASAAYVSGTAPYRVDGLSVATSSTTAGLGVSAINVGPLDTSSQMQSEIPTGNLAASRDLVAYELATGNQILLSHNAANNKASNAANVDQVAISADGRYVVFSALDATRLGNGGVAFTDADPLRADWFATNTQTGQIRLLTHASGNDNASAGAAVSWQGVGGKGSYAVFSTANAGAFGFTDDSPEVSDLLAVGLQDGVIRLITTNGPASPNVSNGQAISLLKISGDHVYFTANDATKFGFASDAGASQASLFRYDLSTGKLKLLSHAIGDTSAALAGAYVSNSLTVSPDGRYVAFALGTGTSSGGFSIPTLGGNPGHALFVTDTTTGNIRLVNSSYLSTTGTALSYASWADVGTKPRFFSGDGTKLIWQSDYLSYVGNGVTGGQYDDGVVLLNLANGVQPAGTAMPNRLLSPSATNPGSLSTGANATLVGVSKDGEFAYFTALNAAWFGNDGVAFTDAYPSVMDLFKVNLNTYRVELISGQNGVSSGQVASLRDVTEGGNLVYSLPSTTGSGIDLWTDVSTLIDLDSNDDTSGEVFGSSNDNITSKRSFTLRARVLPNQQVTLLDKGVAVPSGTVTATAQGDVSWTLQNVSLGQHTYSLLDTLQQAPIVLDGNPGNSSLVVTVLNALGANDRPATATLTVSGVAQEGGSLSASLSNLSDADGAITATVFQWQQRVGSSWVDLAGYGANTATLTIPADQSFVGKSVRVVVATTDALGGTTSFTGDTQSIANVDDAATGLLVVSGEAEVGGTLTASLSEVNDADGEIIATSFRWQQNTGSNAAPVWVDISGASTNTLEVGASLTARQVRVVATTTDELGGTTELTTVQTIFSAVDQAHITVTDSNTATNSVSEAAAIGTPVGLTVFASDEHADGEVFTMIYSLIDTAGGRFAINATTGVVTVAGTLNYSSASSHTIKVRASSSDGYQQEQSFTIAVTKANSLPTGSVSISGTPTQGQTLTAANTLADPDGIPSSGTGAIAYQWKANGTAISGATSSTYVLTQAEVGKAITVTASYTDNGGTAESVTSAATAAVAAPLPVITLGVSPTSVTEDGVPNLVYTFTRSGPTASPLTVNYTIGGSANALDYTGATPGSGKTISFDPGSSTATLVIDPTADAFFEADETVILTLVSASTYSVGTPGAVTGTITNDDALPTVRVTDASIPEGNSGTKNLNFLISLSTPSGQVVTVDYATANNTATAGSDYTSTSGSLTIQPGATSGVVSVPILGDTTAELDETFFLNLTNATGGVTIARGQAIGTIINDDGVGGLVLTGTSGPDTLTGSTTNDTLTGLAGADILDGQGGADTFVYTALTDSLLGGRDSLRSFNPGEGDRIKLPNLPTAVFYGGSVAASISAPAVSSAYAAAGAGGLAARGAVSFATGSGRTQRLYLSVNDGTAAFNPNSDLVMEVTGMVGAPSVVGSLTAANYFI